MFSLSFTALAASEAQNWRRSAMESVMCHNLISVTNLETGLLVAQATCLACMTYVMAVR